MLLISTFSQLNGIINGSYNEIQEVQAATDPVQDYNVNPYQLAFWRFKSKIVHYKIDNSDKKVTNSQLSAIQQAVNELNSKTDFTFIRDDNISEGIIIKNSSNMNAVASTSWDGDSQGYLRNSTIELNNSDLSSSTKTVIEHELGHAIGLKHNGSDVLMSANNSEGKGERLTDTDIQAFNLAGSLPPGVYKTQNTPIPTVVSVFPRNRRIGMYNSYWQVESDPELTARISNSPQETNFVGASFHPTSRVIRPDGTIVYALPNGKYVADYGWDLESNQKMYDHDVLQDIGNPTILPTVDLRDENSAQTFITPDIIKINSNSSFSDTTYDAPGGDPIGEEPAGSAWAVGEIKKAKGSYWYEIGLNCWLRGNIIVNSAYFNTTKSVTTVRNAKLFNSRGEESSRSLAVNSSWAVGKQVVMHDQLLYQVSTDEYVLAYDVTV